MKRIKLFEYFYDEEEVDTDRPQIGDNVRADMGTRKTGKVIAWFNWRDADDGTYKEPDRENYVPVQWDDGTKGFEPISNLIDVDSGEAYGVVVSDDEIEARYDDWTIDEEQFEWSTPNSGWIVLTRPYDENCDECDTEKSDNFIIYDDGRIAFDNWYPESLYNKLVDYIKSRDDRPIKENKTEAKYKKGDKVNYIPKLSGHNPKKKLEIDTVKWQETDDLADMMGVKSKPTWVYGFKGSNLQAVEKDIKPIKENKNKDMKYIRKQRLFETGEWCKDVDLEFVLNNSEVDDDCSNWIREFYDDLLWIKERIRPITNFEIIDIKGFDMYQGPYANVKVDDDNYTMWTIGVEDIFIEDFVIDNSAPDQNRGFVGTKEDVLYTLKEIYEDVKKTHHKKVDIDSFDVEIDEIDIDNDDEIQFGEEEIQERKINESLGNDVSTELNREMKKIWNFTKFTDHLQPRGIITPGRFLDLGEKKGYINRIEGDTVFVESIDGSNEMFEVSFAEVAKNYKIKDVKEEVEPKKELKEGKDDVPNPLKKKEKGKKDEKTEKIQNKAQSVKDSKLKNKLGGPNEK